ncbi:MAG TPA: hypothetical protein VMT38_04375 [Terracidiphilus sp.]|nr:hypothetical protein [Terracidiphilus sp.]
MNICKWVLAVSAALPLFSPCIPIPAHAQQIDPDHGPAGTLVSGIDQKIGGSVLAAPQRQDALVIAGKLRDILVRDQAIAKPIGDSIRVNRVYGKVTDWAEFDSGLPFFAGAAGAFFEAQEKPSPSAFKGADFGIFVNTVLQCPLNQYSPPGANGKPWMVNGNLPVIEGGRRTGDFRGYSIYDTDCVIIGRGSAPPFIPLTREQFIQLQIAGYQSRLDDMNKEYAGKTNIPAVQQAIASANQLLTDKIAQLQQQLAGMTSEDRNGPAAVNTNSEEGALAGPGEEGAMPLSVPNPAFYDHSLPATTIQSVAVYIQFLQTGPKLDYLPAGYSEDWRAANEKIRDELDWAALAALVR